MSATALRPGVTPVRHDDHHLQVGSVVLPDSSEVRRLLAALSSPSSSGEDLPSSLPARRALDALAAAGLVVPDPSSSFETWLAGAHGPSYVSRAATRAVASVALAGPASLTAPLSDSLASGGVGPSSAPPDLSVVLSLGPLRREVLDGFLQAGAAHLPVAGTASSWEIGPLVVPGQTACVRCADLALADVEPRRAIVVDQLARSSSPMPVDPLAQTLALSLAAREVLAFVDGDLPSTWSASLTVPAGGLPSRQEFLRHPLCGCAWDALAVE